MADTPDRPNILWLTCEDIGPHLGCFGDSYSTSPNLDALAARAAIAALGTQEECRQTRELYPIATLVTRMRERFSIA